MDPQGLFPPAPTDRDAGNGCDLGGFCGHEDRRVRARPDLYPFSGMSDTLVTAREAVERHAWEEAREAFTLADSEEPLGPNDLRLLADAAWWSGHPEEAVEALERAHARFLDTGDKVEAAIVAMWLMYLALRRGTMAVATGWMAKAERLLENEPESPAHAWLHLMRMSMALFARTDLKEAIAEADRALELARRYDVQGVEALALSFKGYALVTKGEWKEGMALIDEAAAAAVSGDLDPQLACGVYCNTIACCAAMADYRRAGEWTDEAERWMLRRSLGGYPGQCRVHRAELKKLHGSYPEAEQEARVACEELERFHLFDTVGLAHYEIGEIRLRMGDLEAAEQSFMKAYEYGWHSQPGMALLMLAKGDTERAAKAISSRLERLYTEDADAPAKKLSRARHLPAQVTIALAVDDLDTAVQATEELEQIAVEYEQPAFEAAALTARGAFELHSGRPHEAAAVLEKAWRLWFQMEIPYESAKARVLLGRARFAAGDETTGRMELRAARSTFERLGAALDLGQVDELLGDEVGPGGDGRRVIKTFMFTDIVTSTDLVGLIGDDAWKDLLRWHDRALRSEFARHKGQEVRHTGDGFFVAFDNASDAVKAAVGVQRRLAKHRREHGFAPWVRIGLHTTEATPQGSDYAGHGVHVAARVADLAEREGIVMSSDGLQAAGTIAYPVSEPRKVELKGVNEPVEVHTIDWR